MRCSAIIACHVVALLALVNPTLAQTGSIGGMVWSDEDPNGVLDPGEEGIADVGVVLFDDGAPCSVPFGIDPYGQFSLGSMEETTDASGGTLTCNTFASFPFAGGQETLSQEFRFYFDYLRIRDDHTQKPCSDDDCTGEQRRVQAWLVVKNEETAEEYNSAVFQMEYCMGLGEIEFTPANSANVDLTVPVNGPSTVNPVRFSIRLKVRWQEWACAFDDDWYPPEGADDFDYDSVTQYCGYTGFPVYRGPDCFMSVVKTEPDGTYLFDALPPDPYRVAIDPTNYDPGRPLANFSTTTDNGSLSGVDVLLDGDEQVSGVDFGFAANAVPTVSEWGLAGLTLLVLSAGTLLLMRRRTVA